MPVKKELQLLAAGHGPAGYPQNCFSEVRIFTIIPDHCY